MIHIILSTRDSDFMQKALGESVPKRNELIQWKEFGTDGILLNPNSGDYFELDEVGLTIWKHADGRHSINEIVDELMAHFKADPEEVARETAEFLGELAGKGLISF